MRRLGAILCLIVLAFCLEMSPLARATIAGPAAVIEVGLAPQCDHSTLTAAIAAAGPGDEIHVQDATFNEAPLTIGIDLTLEGGYGPGAPGTCLAPAIIGQTRVRCPACSDQRILLVQDAAVGISGFVFENNLNGGGVRVEDATLNLEDVYLQYNQAQQGGGLQVVRSTANLTDCRITDNTATDGGGGLYAGGTPPDSTVELTGVTFRRNGSDADGGALYVTDGAHVTTHEWVAIGDTPGSGNSAAGDGGGAYIEGGGSRLRINASEVLSYVSSNRADRHGGGIYVVGGRVVLNGAIDPQFGERIVVSSNEADAEGDGVGSGGGLYARDGATVLVNETWIYDNAGDFGGGVYLWGSAFTGDDVRIQGNQAGSYGGGLRAVSGSAAFLGNGSEVGGTGNLHHNSGTRGGGIGAEGSGTSVAIDDSAIRGNFSWDRGGGVYLTDGASFAATNGSLVEHNETQSGSSDGGGIFARGPNTEVTIDASDVYSNTAGIRGGGLYIDEGAIAAVQNNSWVEDNRALDSGEGGGGAYVSGANSVLNVDNSVFTYNRTEGYGGGVLNDGATVNIRRTAMSYNSAAWNGGGVYNQAGTVTAAGSSFYGNWTPGGYGGWLSSMGPGSVVDLSDNLFSGNSAPVHGGGAIVTYRTDLSVHRGYFTLNSSDDGGSAIMILGSDGPEEPPAEVVNCFIVNNSAAGSGSSLYVEYAPATLLHNTFARHVQGEWAIFADSGAIVSMTNNILSNYTLGIRRPSGGTGQVTAHYTLFWGNASDYDANPGVSVHDSVYDNPVFFGMLNYHLMPGSAAIDAGADAGVTSDYDGDHRPAGHGYDIGADEVGFWVYLPLVARGD